jgi:hypothetical protein
MGSDGFVDGLMVHQMGERGGGRDGREGGREGKKERWRFLIYLLLSATSWIKQLRGQVYKSAIFIHIVVLYRFPQNLTVNKCSQSSPPLCICLVVPSLQDNVL